MFRPSLKRITAGEGGHHAHRRGDIMSDDLLTASASDDVYQTIEHMRLRGIRRVPVVDVDGKLAGIVSADDLLEFLAEEMSELSRIGSWQQSHERRVRQ